MRSKLLVTLMACVFLLLTACSENESRNVALTIDRAATYIRAGRFVTENMEKDQTISTQTAYEINKSLRIANQIGADFEAEARRYKIGQTLEITEEGKLRLADLAKSFENALSRELASPAFANLPEGAKVRLGGILKGLQKFGPELVKLCAALKASPGSLSLELTAQTEKALYSFEAFDYPINPTKQKEVIA